jgi:CheY-like chemotaxis protein
MDSETLRRAVEPFFSTKDVGKGTGLGLSMIHGLAAQLGGDFELSSELGEGTRADLWLPAAAAEEAAASLSSRPEVPTATQSLTILLVDDEELVRDGTAEMLRELGHEVVEASGGAQALGKLGARLRVDVVITDYRMPRMNGVRLAERIRELHPSMPILLITGYSDFTSQTFDLPRLAKPFRQADLAARVNALIQDHSNIVRMSDRRPS